MCLRVETKFPFLVTAFLYLVCGKRANATVLCTQVFCSLIIFLYLDCPIFPTQSETTNWKFLFSCACWEINSCKLFIYSISSAYQNNKMRGVSSKRSLNESFCAHHYDCKLKLITPCTIPLPYFSFFLFH